MTDWEKNQLSETLAFLGIMGALLRAPLCTYQYHIAVMLVRFQGSDPEVRVSSRPASRTDELAVVFAGVGNAVNLFPLFVIAISDRRNITQYRS